jgi:hypothetical protein
MMSRQLKISLRTMRYARMAAERTTTGLENQGK